MTEVQKKKCTLIIHGAAASGAAMAAVMAQAPGSDNIPLVALEVAMTIALGAVFGISLTESSAKSIAASSTGTLVGRGVYQFLFGWVPGLGNFLNAGTAATVIEGLGWAIVSDFDHNKTR